MLDVATAPFPYTVRRRHLSCYNLHQAHNLPKGNKTMNLISLATLTRVDPTFPSGAVHRHEGRLVFHSTPEKNRWLSAVEALLREAGVPVADLKAAASLEAIERHLSVT